jgi:lysine decarboxylase
MRLRVDAPLLDGYLSYLESDATPFITPGHKGRASKLDADLGAVVAGDVPLYGAVPAGRAPLGFREQTAG